MGPIILKRQTQSSSKHLRGHILQEFGRTLLLVVDPGSLQASMATRITDLFGCDRVVLFQIEPGRAAFSPHFSFGIPLSDLNGFELRRRGPLAKWLLVNETCLVLSRAFGIHQYLAESEKEMLARLGIQVCAPLISLNRLIGIVMLGSSDQEWNIGDEEIELLKSLAAQAALALENASLAKQHRDRLRRIYRAESLAAAGQLAAGVAHEIRNPLTSIRSTIQYILQDYPNASPKGLLLQELLSEVDRIDGTVNGLLAVTRTGEFDPAPVNLTEELEHSLVLIRPQALHKSVVIELKKSADLRVMGVANELKQVFLNILLNALQAVSEGGTIRCECEEWTQELASGRWAQVTILDSGVGIPPEDLDKIFDPFFTTKREGTGLGLSVCHGIIQRHEGEIDIQSVLGKGTAVFIRLPLL
jgi:signal transduction histidine kinase